MRLHRKPLRLRASVWAVHCAVLALAGQAFAAEPDIAELTKPQSTVEAGVATVSNFSAKANEYNGIRRKEPFLFGNVGRAKSDGLELGLSDQLSTALVSLESPSRRPFAKATPPSSAASRRACKHPTTRTSARASSPRSLRRAIRCLPTRPSGSPSTVP